MNFAHPSVDRFKDKPLIITPAPACRIGSNSCDSSGILNFSKNIFYNIIPKSSLAPNSARLNKDLKVGNIQRVSLDKIINANQNQQTFLSLNEIPFPEFDQGGSQNCQLIACLTRIQKDVNFPIDWGQFFKCLPKSTPTPDSINRNKEISSSQKEYFKFLFQNIESSGTKQHAKLFNALFGDGCLPIGPAPEGITNCADGKYPVSTSQGEGGSADGCKETCNPDTVGIRIKPIILDGDIDSAKDLHKLRKIFGPRPIVIQGNDYIKMELTMFGASWDSLKGKNDNELRELLINEIMQKEGLSRLDAQGKTAQLAFGSHAITLIDSEGPDSNGAYKLTLRNSWKNTQDITITWSNPSDLSIDKLILPEWVTNVNGVPNPFLEEFYKRSEEMRKYLYNNIVYTVEPCQPNITIKPDDNCKEQNCKDLGYDTVDPSPSDSDCFCKCSEGTNNIGRLIQRTYCKNCTKCECPNDPSIICGPRYNPETQEIAANGCDCICKDPRGVYPCSGADGQSFIVDASIMSKFNIVSHDEVSISLV